MLGYKLDVLLHHKANAKLALPTLLDLLRSVPDSGSPTNSAIRAELLNAVRQLDPSAAPNPPAIGRDGEGEEGAETQKRQQNRAFLVIGRLQENIVLVDQPYERPIPANQGHLRFEAGPSSCIITATWMKFELNP